jgi:hypothetical protein
VSAPATAADDAIVAAAPRVATNAAAVRAVFGILTREMIREIRRRGR